VHLSQNQGPAAWRPKGPRTAYIGLASSISFARPRTTISFLRQCSVCSTATTLAEAKKQGAVFAWGNFLTVAINFVIVAWVLFLIVKARLQ
jgi:large-conductance mechanosensitive channel